MMDVNTAATPLDSTRMVDAFAAIVGGQSLEAVVRNALEQARAMTGARYAAIGILSADRKTLARFVTAGVPESVERAIGDPPRGRGVLGLLIHEPKLTRVDDIGAHPQSFGFPLHHPKMTTLLGAPMLLDGAAWGTFYLTDKVDGQPFTVDDERVLTALADLTVRVASPLYELETLRERVGALDREVAAYETSIDIARALAGEPRLDNMMELIVKRARALTDARGAVLALVSGDEITVAAVAGELPAGLVGQALALEADGMEVIAAGRSVSVLAASPLLPRLKEQLEMRSALMVPLKIRRQPMGVVVCVDRLVDGPDFADRDVALIDAYGTSAAVALTTARSAEEQALRRAISASERERAHWARELHDQTLQELAAIKLMVDLALRAQTKEERVEILHQASGQLDGAAVELRRIVTELRPATLDALGLRSAVEVLTERLGTLTGIDVTFECLLPDGSDGEEDRLTPELEGIVYRIVQEALNNVVRHAGATHAHVRIVEADGLLTVGVSDDGVGFDPTVQGAGFGLIGMRERAELVNGEVRVESRPGVGTSILFTVPVSRTPAEGHGTRPAGNH